VRRTCRSLERSDNRQDGGTVITFGEIRQNCENVHADIDEREGKGENQRT
jgi:stress response protein SCP2